MGERVLVSINPATLEEIGRTETMNAAEIKKTIEQAERAFKVWSQIPLNERTAYLLKVRDCIMDNADSICSLISKETGKPLIEALSAEVMLTVKLITYYAKRAPEILCEREIPMHMLKFVKKSTIVYEPLGVISIITPWNYPFGISMSNIVFALLAGNCVVFKPSPEVPFVGKKIEELFKASNLPRGVFNLVIAMDDELGTTLIAPPIRKVIFTGSTKVGKWIHETASRNLIPTVMELGGKDPMIVLDDADLELAANGAVWAAFMNCGQTCSSVERLYVHKSLHERFVSLLLEKTRALKVGVASDWEVDIGPLINERQLKTVEEHVLDALKKGARLICGGKRPENLKGYFYEPTILTEVNHNMKVMREETFGPVLPVMAYDTDEAAIELANDSNYGLTASVWSRNRERAWAFAKRLKAGTVTINDHAFSYGLCETPWQGMKESGLGRSHSDAGLLEFVYPKHVNNDTTPFPVRRRPWWFPYSKEAYEIQKEFMNSTIDKTRLFELAKKVIFNKKYIKTLY